MKEATRCRSCNAPMFWIKSATTGKNIPCDVEVIRVVTEAGDVVSGYASHFSSCPNAAQHRKAKP